MSEATREPEFGRTPEYDQKSFEKAQELARERLKEAAEKAEVDKPSLETIHERLERAQAKQEKIEITDQETRASESPIAFGSSLKNQSVNRHVQQAQKQLSRPERSFSKVIHQPVVRAVSDAAEGTIARPSGLFAGGLFSVISSIAVLYICRHYGYEYNFMIGLASFAGGFTFGILVEGLYRGIFKLFKR